MKLFHWDDVWAIGEYLSGDIVIMAESLEDAYKAFEREKPESIGILEYLKEADPIVYDSSKALLFPGSA